MAILLLACQTCRSTSDLSRTSSFSSSSPLSAVFTVATIHAIYSLRYSPRLVRIHTLHRSRSYMADLGSLIVRVRAGLSPVEIVHASHPAWPHPRRATGNRVTLRVAVLDSSFNPPSRAHLALANFSRPRFSDDHDADEDDYDAKLLLLSVRNADKQLAAGDATHAQRLEMMALLMHDISRPSTSDIHTESPSIGEAQLFSGRPHDNVAVAIIDEPTFVGKSTVLLSYLRHRLSLHPAMLSASSSSSVSGSVTSFPAALSAPQPSSAPGSASVLSPQLTFLVGTDTLERLFAPRFYDSPETMRASLRRFLSAHPDGDDARVVCARRSMHSEVEERKLSAAVRELAEEDRVLFIDVPEGLRSVSSTQIRKGAKGEEQSWREMVTPTVAAYIKRHDLYRA